MSEETNGHDSPSRLDRLEKIVEVLANVQVKMRHERLLHLRAQNARSGDLRGLSERARVLARQRDERSRQTHESFRALAKAKAAMIAATDQFIRQRPLS
jgi:ElaB/YqjD/DUF883 family membrane-anchored ribosome-binding protein